MLYPELPESRAVDVHSSDGTRLNTRVFGPEDGYPIVLAHGITCEIRIWAYQIADLSRDYRVIAYDHRGHGDSEAPRSRDAYSLDHLAADLDAVLAATLAPGERAVIAGHSMGGMAITSWAQRYPRRVYECADAVALINTTTGDLLRNVQLFQVPSPFKTMRIRSVGAVLKAFGATPLPALPANKKLVAYLAVGRDADPAVSRLVHDMFAATSPAGRGGWVRVLVDNFESEHISLRNLTVPALVIGSRDDRLLPLKASRRIATNTPNLAAFVELPGGHCSILEHPDEVNRELRVLVASVTGRERISS